MNQTLLNKYNLKQENIPKNDIVDRMYQQYTKYYFVKNQYQLFVKMIDTVKKERSLTINEIDFEQWNIEYYKNELTRLREIKNDVLRIFYSNYEFFHYDDQEMFMVAKNVVECMVEYYIQFDKKEFDQMSLYEFTKELYIALQIYYYVDNLLYSNTQNNINKLLENV